MEFEPQFTSKDMDELLALAKVEEETCQGCGQPIHEGYDDDTAGEWVPRVVTCWSCYTKQKGEAGLGSNEYGKRVYPEHIPRET